MAAAAAGAAATGDVAARLEETVMARRKATNSDLEAGRRLLKLYAAEPERCKPEVVAVALQQALVRLPDADFIAACCLVPLRVQEEEPVKGVVRLAELLETGQYGAFWRALTPEAAARVPEFEKDIRKLMAANIGRTYQQISVAAVKEMLHITSQDELAAVAAAHQWLLAAGSDTVTLPLTEDNQPSAKAGENEKIPLEKVTRVLQLIGR